MRIITKLFIIALWGISASAQSISAQVHAGPPSIRVHKINSPVTLPNGLDMNKGMNSYRAGIDLRLPDAPASGGLFTGSHSRYLNKLTILTSPLAADVSTTPIRSILMECTYVISVP